MKLTFHGAARSVTGSRHLVQANGKRILLDCGLVQGPRREAEARNRNFGFDPKSIDAVVLSHAHIDHAGNLPALVKGGFDGPIFCTDATRDLAGVMMMDSANIQVMDARHLNSEKRPSAPPVEPLYTPEDARAAIALLTAFPYTREMTIFPGIKVRFDDAGHILGSAIVSLQLSENGRNRRLVFSGDIGRRKFPILRDPSYVAQADVVITESTYGNRDHAGDVAHAKAHLLDVVGKVIARRGRVLVPSFALGRAQSLTYLLHELWAEKKLPLFPIYVDSPLSIDVTAVYKLHPECFDAETARYMTDGIPGDPFGFRSLTYVRTTDESKALNGRKGPCVIIAASGMCEGGRILHHLKHGIGDPDNAVLLVGFCAQHTLGRRLADGADMARIYGVEYPVKAEIIRLDGMSQHAGRQELLAWNASQKKAEIAFCVHGEETASMALADGMRAAGFGRVEVPALGSTFEI